MTVTYDHAALQTEEFPPGWTVALASPPRGQRQFEGHATRGAAFVHARQLDQLLRFDPAPGYACNRDSLDITVTLNVYRQDHIGPIRLVPRQIGLVE